ncbi:MAG TPA: hypothetical protein V6D18_05460 [Thermosynechococcaceae cyanobacterium]
MSAWVIGTIAGLLIGLSSTGAIAQSPKSPRLALPLRPRLVCPEELEPLTRALLKNLPGYINRLSLRSRSPGAGFAIVASQPEFMPLPTGSSEYPQDQSLQQVFFTVLERQYAQNRVTEFQQFHWLFLAKTEGGWRLALLYSRLGSAPTVNQKLLSPPRESSQGMTGQAVRLWLRDCQVGAVDR